MNGAGGGNDGPHPEVVVEPAEGPPTSRARSRRVVRIALVVLLAVVWIRLALFGWLFPLIERHVDSPEFDAETSAPSEPGAATDG